MSAETQHREALVETARLELGRAHRGALAMDAAEMRRGLEIAVTALRDAGAVPVGEDGPAEERRSERLRELAGALDTALAELDDGALTDMEILIESVRKELAA